MDTDLLSGEKMMLLLGDRGLLSFIHCTVVIVPVPSEMMLADESPSINNSSGPISLTLDTFPVCMREKEQRH